MTTSAGLRRPPGRYDERRPLPRPVIIGGALVLVLALAGFSFAAYRHYSAGRTPFTNLDYTVESDQVVLVRFQVVVHAGRTVQCVLQARDRENTEVGSLVTTIGPGESGTVTKALRLTTKHRAVAGEVLSCRPA